jgi:hypothetical protein
MDMGIKEIEVEIQELELNERASLAKWIVESFGEQTEAKHFDITTCRNLDMRTVQGFFVIMLMRINLIIVKL